LKILVTGGAGFIGSHLVKALLARGDSVTILDDFNDFYDPLLKRANIALRCAGAEVIEGDICNADLVRGIITPGRFDGIVHLAARAGVRPSIERPDLYLETNITGTWQLLEAARLAGCKHFIFASSSSVYGAAKTVPFSEDLALVQTLSPYAATKIAGEQLCSNYSHLHGMRAVCLRFFTVYGASQRPDLAIHKFCSMVDRGESIPKFGSGETRRDYTHIDDIIQGILGAISYRGPLFDIFNLGENQTTTLNQLIAMIESELGKKAIIQQLPEQPGDMPVTCADVSKARRLLGYQPQVPFEEGIKRFVDWYKHPA
jgi:UDP-glucuronate 4-epimerase